MTTSAAPDLGLGIGWREELAAVVEDLHGLGFVEVVAERLPSRRPLPLLLERLRLGGIRVVAHGVSLSLGSAERPDQQRLAELRKLAERLGAPVVSEHVAFVRAGGLDAGHLLPVPRTREALRVLTRNVRLAQAELPVPLALEHIAALIEWPESQLPEAAFLAELLDRTGVLLLLDVANLYAGVRNHGVDAAAFLDALPLERVAYVHVAGGVEHEGLYHDTHAHPVVPGTLRLLEELAARRAPPGVLLERDGRYPPAAELAAELAAISAAAGLATSDRAPPDAR